MASTRGGALRRVITASACVGVVCAGTAAGAAWGASTTSATTVYACVDKTTGAMRQVSDRTLCPATENPLHWDVTGPAGPAGPPGAAGAAGTQVRMTSVSAPYLPPSTTNDAVMLVSMAVAAAATYEITAIVDINATGTQTGSAQCFLDVKTPSTWQPTVDNQFMFGSERIDLLAVVHVITAGTVDLDCMRTVGASMSNAHMDAVVIPDVTR